MGIAVALLVPAVLAVAPSVRAEEKNLGQIAAKNPELQTFVKAAKAAGLDKLFKEKGPFTVLAPTNGAFDKLGEGKLDELLKPENKDKLKAILSRHLIKGNFNAAEIKTTKTFKTLAGTDVTFTVTDKGELMVGKTKVSRADITAANGILHLLDGVLDPGTPKN
jgi:uncharacterized surface protein with fasciclin (FAS1) repeats